ncbi:MAG: hypothetical protein COA97_09415 [Flavobacteriales bacterium]|nr:MAG: hypothetical protein COA97_09415 [Flavobacteriales bacterium]
METAMKKLLLIILLFSFTETTLIASSGNSKIDSIITNVDDYSQSVMLLRKIVPENLLDYIKEVDDIGKCKIYNALCWIYFNSDPPKAMKYAKLQSPLAEKIKNQDAIIYSYDNLGWLYLSFTENEKGIEYMLKSLKKKEEIRDTAGISVSLSGLAGTYYKMNNFSLALNYFNQTLEIERNADRKVTEAKTLGNIGLCYVGLGEIDKGLETYLKTVEAYKEAGVEHEAGVTYGNLGLIYLNHKKDYSQALYFLKKSAKLHGQQGDVSSLSGVYGAMAEVYSYQNDFTKALIYGKKAVKNAILSNDKGNMMESHRSLAFAFYNNKNYQLAYENFQVAFKLKDSIFDTKSSEQIAEMQTKYDTEKKEAENSLLLAEKEIDRVELDKKSTQQKMLMLGLLLALLLVGYVAYSLNQKKKTNKLLNIQNEEISNKNAIIEEKNKDITDSINYAQRIQDAILPKESLLKEHYESFIYYQPKDIVSGDFYWIKEIGDKIYFSVVDCTGHGVPGAFMSIIGANSLNKIVEDLKIEKTGEMLDKLNNLVNIALGKENTSDEILSVRDGMDISICSIDRVNNILEYSGANNSLYILRKPNNKIAELEIVIENDDTIFYEIKSNKMAIGGGDNLMNYTTHKIQLEKEDVIYLFSDGYADQFGGPKGKKFMYKPFKRMFLSIQDKTMDEQRFFLDTTLREWKGDLDQLDDICVMGVRI